MAEITSSVLVIGGGVAGMETASSLAEMGQDVLLIEREAKLGGNAAHWACMATEQCARCSACLIEDDIARIASHPKINVLTHAEVVGVEGQSGAFSVQVQPKPGSIKERTGRPDWILEKPATINCKAVVLATGFEPFNPKNQRLLGYGHLPEVYTTFDVDECLKQDDLDSFLPKEPEKNRIAFIQCVGSRDRARGQEYCSQFCCKTSIRLVNRMKHLRPDLDVTIYYIDLQIMGKEFRHFYEESRSNIRFMQGVPAEVRPGSETDHVRVVGIDQATGLGLEEEYNRIVLAVGIAPDTRNNHLIEQFGLGLNEYGFIDSANQNGVVRTSKPRVYLAGACAGPVDIQASRLQAMAATKRILMDLQGRQNDTDSLAVYGIGGN